MKILWRTLHWTGLIDSLYGILKGKSFCMGECRLGIYGGATIRIMMHFPMSSILKKIIPLHYKIITWIFL